MSKILGIDPGANTGLAFFLDGRLTELQTIQPLDLHQEIAKYLPDLVIFEDSRLQSIVWNRKVNTAQMLKIARNIGMVDAYCSQIVDVCDLIGIPCVGVSPKSKGKKLDAKEFKALTGWTKQSNSHERDSATIAWQYRGFKK